MKNEVTLFMVVDLKHTFFSSNAKNEVTLFMVGELKTLYYATSIHLGFALMLELVYEIFNAV